MQNAECKMQNEEGKAIPFLLFILHSAFCILHLISLSLRHQIRGGVFVFWGMGFGGELRRVIGSAIGVAVVEPTRLVSGFQGLIASAGQHDCQQQ